MADRTYEKEWSDIDTATYDWSAKLFRSVKNLLNVHMKLHADEDALQGDIFLFNHFSRFETFIPQYLIYERTGNYCWSIASSEFFDKETVLSKYLRSLGVIPHDHDRLFPILATQILHGRKVIIFPEGGMVKDRRVMDKRGEYSIYSRIRGERRKHHTGPAVLAQALEAFKATIRTAYDDKKTDQLTQWKKDLKFDNLDELLMAAIKPTLIVPANITFYPIRSSDNLLLQGVEMFAGGLSIRQTEELLVEGNIMLQDTDMDVRMGKPIAPYHAWHWWNHDLIELVSSEFGTLDDVFALHAHPKTWKQKLLGFYFKKNAEATRNRYMKDIYANVTVNLSHLASHLIMHCIGKGRQKIEKCLFYRTLYITIKLLQQDPKIHLQRHLLNPIDYFGLIDGHTILFDQFICVAKESGLIAEDDDNYHFLPKLCEEYDFDTIRMENLIAVYSNEVQPIKAVHDTIAKAFKKAKKIDSPELAEYFFGDELRLYHRDKTFFSGPQFDDINGNETATAPAEPFLLHPEHPNGCGALLIHGLLASPAEVRGYGERLAQQGFTVYGMRIRGHGTSPYDLRERSLNDWCDSVDRSITILKRYCPKIVLVGFSTGGALALKFAAENREKIHGIIAVAVPIEFLDPTLMLVPLLHGTNKVVEWLSSYEGVMPFIVRDTEHPDINYRAIPVRALYELRMLIQNMGEVLPLVEAPTLLIYADGDPIVSVNSAEIVLKGLGAVKKELKIVHAERHGILNENLAGTWALIDDFINKLCLAN
ncbi:MAG: alpha/beta fold hydrolase [Gammaproteobacteria bacterium]